MFELIEDRRPWYQRHKFAFLFVALFATAALLDILTALLARRFPDWQPLVAAVRFALPVAGGAVLAVLMVWEEDAPDSGHAARLVRVFGVVLLVCVGFHWLARIYPVLRPGLRWIDGFVFAAAADWERRRLKRAEDHQEKAF